MTESKPKRRWFRFSLRTLFVVVTVIGIGAGWVAYQLNWIRQRHEFAKRYDSKSVFYDIFIVDGKSAKCPWCLRLFGEEAHPYLTVKKERMEEANRLFPEATVFEDHAIYFDDDLSP